MRSRQANKHPDCNIPFTVSTGDGADAKIPGNIPWNAIDAGVSSAELCCALCWESYADCLVAMYKDGQCTLRIHTPSVALFPPTDYCPNGVIDRQSGDGTIRHDTWDYWILGPCINTDHRSNLADQLGHKPELTYLSKRMVATKSATMSTTISATMSPTRAATMPASSMM